MLLHGGLQQAPGRGIMHVYWVLAHTGHGQGVCEVLCHICQVQHPKKGVCETILL